MTVDDKYKRQECFNCRFMVRAEVVNSSDNYVECRRHAPSEFDGGAVWPVVFVGDWCGDWEARRG